MAHSRPSRLPSGLPALVAAGLLAVACASGASRPGAGSSRAAPRDTLTRAVLVSSERFSPQSGYLALARFRPDLPVVDSGGECVSRPLPASPLRSVTLYLPSQADARMSIFVAADSAGKMVRGSEMRGPPMRVQGGPTMTDAERTEAFRKLEAATRRTLISLDFATGQAILRNVGGDRPAESVLTSIESAEAAEALDHPVQRARAALARCAPGGT